MGWEIVPTIRLQWNSRFTRRMGDARVTDRYAHQGIVRLSSKLFPLATPEARWTTMVHEIAHIYAEIDVPGCHHGPAWAWWMTMFGLPAARCFEAEGTFTNALALHVVSGRFGAPCPQCGKLVHCSKKTRKAWIRHKQARGCLSCGARLEADFAVHSLKPLTLEDATTLEIA